MRSANGLTALQRGDHGLRSISQSHRLLFITPGVEVQPCLLGAMLSMPSKERKIGERQTILKLRHTFAELLLVGDEVWEAVEHIENADSDIDVMLPNEDGTITFVQQFYNGGTCLSEVIEEGIQKLRKDGNI